MVATAFAGLVAIVLFEGREPDWVRSSAGDAVVVVPVYAAIAIIRPRWSSLAVAASTFAIASAVEFSQLYHGPSIDAFRRTFVGRMTIGSTFVPSDFLCYLAGTVTACAFDWAVARRAA